MTTARKILGSRRSRSWSSIRSNLASRGYSSRKVGGGSSDSSRSKPLAEIKYYKADGTPVYGAPSQKVDVPIGATARKGANVSLETQEK